VSDPKMSSVTGATGKLKLDPGGDAALRWTSAWRGLLTLTGTSLQVRHPPHVHDYFSICVVDSGEAEVFCRGESFRAGPGSVVLLSPWDVHEELCSAGNPWWFRSMCPAVPTMRRVLGLDASTNLGEYEFDRPVIHDALLANQLDQLFRRLEHSPTSLVEDELTDRVRAGLRRHLRPKAQGLRLRGVRAAETARARIVESRQAMTSMSELSAMTGMSRFHLSRVFRDVTGLPPYAFFEQVRLARAKVLLRKGHDLSAVAMTLGYSDQSHFHRQFRENSATTPGRYARALRTVFGGRR
jgi:AraC-like DNA-binding protein